MLLLLLAVISHCRTFKDLYENLVSPTIVPNINIYFIELKDQDDITHPDFDKDNNTILYNENISKTLNERSRKDDYTLETQKIVNEYPKLDSFNT